MTHMTSDESSAADMFFSGVQIGGGRTYPESPAFLFMFEHWRAVVQEWAVTIWWRPPDPRAVVK